MPFWNEWPCRPVWTGSHIYVMHVYGVWSLSHAVDRWLEPTSQHLSSIGWPSFVKVGRKHGLALGTNKWCHSAMIEYVDLSGLVPLPPPISGICMVFDHFLMLSWSTITMFLQHWLAWFHAIWQRTWVTSSNKECHCEMNDYIDLSGLAPTSMSGIILSCCPNPPSQCFSNIGWPNFLIAGLQHSLAHVLNNAILKWMTM